MSPRIVRRVRPTVRPDAPYGLFLALSALVAVSLPLDWFRADLPGRRVTFGALHAAPGLWAVLVCAVTLVGLTAWLSVNAARRPERAIRVVMVLVIGVAALGVALSVVTLAWGVADVTAQGVEAAPRVALHADGLAFAATGALAAIAAGMCAVLRRRL